MMYPDFGYMEDDKIGKAHDFRLILRLGGVLRPYWRWMALSLFLVLWMTSFDLVIPYLTKEVLDRYVLNGAREVVLRRDESPQEKRLLDRYGHELIPKGDGRRFLFPPEALRSMDRKEMTLLQKEGILSEHSYTLFAPEDADGHRLLGKYPAFFEKYGPYWVLPQYRMKEMRPNDLSLLRRGDLSGIFNVALLVLCILAAHFLFNFFQVYAMEWAGQRVMHDLRMKLLTHLQGFSVSFFDRNPVGRLVTRVTNDVQNIHEMFTSVLIYLLKDVLLLIGILFVLIHFNPGLGLFALSLLPVVLFLTLFFSRRARDAFREIRQKVAQINTFFQENFSGIEVVQLFRREEENGRRFGKINKEHYRANLKQVSLYAFFVPLIDVLSMGAIGILLWYGGGKVVQETITLGVLVAYLAYLRMLFQPIRDLSEKYTILQSAMASLERIYALLDHEEKGPGPTVPFRGEITGRVEFQDVTFAYHGEDHVLKGVSFTALPGETVAIVGATGAGKTSLFHLLERFYEVGNGAIRVDGIDIRDWDLKALRSQIGLVMQDTFLFAGDVEENIRLGQATGNLEGVREAARMVNTEAMIQKWTRGYQTPIGEGGETLSAGEKQLLAFARALYLHPKILLLDEATSHVDQETERLIQDGLDRLRKGRTAIIIAHRLSTVHHADRIVVLHKGRVREIGNHTELMERGGFYAKLYRLQNGASDPGIAPSVRSS